MDYTTIEFLYEEFIISLVVMSLPGERQCQIVGYGCVGDEILLDFDHYYNDFKDIYFENGYLDLHQIEILDNFKEYLKKFDNLDEEFYWDHNQIINHPNWEELRIKTSALIQELFNDNYDVEITRRTEQSQGYLVENTFRKLIIRKE
ncbi:hypothetical protein [Cellulosilyticum sp. I15G10I2]|uniref:hypothetical protein n=1 Tax=Cellulosilyticum sp. I15G10I2 TaxID=1892843 RepID=UPI00085BC4E1|nr:hypothetical protein [Cellulosilyticum sp. I15G10I2]